MNYDINDYVESRLEEWAEWYLKHGDFGLGYPWRSIEGRMIDNGGIIIRGIAPEVLCNTEAEEIEHMVQELYRQDEFLARVLREQYFGKGTAKNKSARLKTSYENFKIHLKMAKHWLAGRLSASYPRQMRY